MAKKTIHCEISKGFVIEEQKSDEPMTELETIFVSLRNGNFAIQRLKSRLDRLVTRVFDNGYDSDEEDPDESNGDLIPEANLLPIIRDRISCLGNEMGKIEDLISKLEAYL